MTKKDECVVIEEYEQTLMEDPMTHEYGAPVGEIMSFFIKKHVKECDICQRAVADGEIMIGRGA